MEKDIALLQQKLTILKSGFGSGFWKELNIIMDKWVETSYAELESIDPEKRTEIIRGQERIKAYKLLKKLPGTMVAGLENAIQSQGLESEEDPLSRPEGVK